MLSSRSPLLKFKLGLGLIGVFSLVLLVLVITQAGATKQDAATDTAANKAADKLNTYVTQNYEIPGSLSEAGYKGDATNITYTKLSDSSYKFCVIYKAQSSGFDGSSVATDLAFGGLAGTGTYDPSSGGTYLYVSPTHHKGANCQTIKPYGDTGSDILGTDYSSSSDLSSLGDIQTQANDSKRKTDMGALQASLESYYASNNTYPTLADLNSETWRSSNMKGFDPTALEDPDGNTQTLLSGTTPSSTQYAYSVTPTGCSDAVGSNNPCFNFGVYAKLEADGSVYSKVSNN